MTYDVAIIGGGIVGLATAYRLTQRFPDRSLIVLEKEDRVAAHQTGRNSGVIHSGIYYTPGSLKARNCRAGKQQLEAFCAAHDVAYETCGKVIVAATEEERPRLHKIYERGQHNGVPCELIGPERLGELEPFVRGVEAIHVPGTGIVDYGGMARALARLVEAAGHPVQLQSPVMGVAPRPDAITLETPTGPVTARHVINCAGLHADRIAQMSGTDPGAQIVPFRGEYFKLKPEAEHLCRTLIYPTPDPNFPFLGVHFTRMVEGGVECGPSAVLAFAREGYTFGAVDARDLWETMTYPGFLALSLKHWRKGLQEMRQSLDRSVYLQSLRHLVPGVQASDLVPAPAGVRAQAVKPNGDLVDDFWIRQTDRMLHVINAPSPAATASLAIGQHLAEQMDARFR